ncbi:zinc finger protein, putative, partial [Ixodes scapularis]
GAGRFACKESILKTFVLRRQKSRFSEPAQKRCGSCSFWLALLHNHRRTHPTYRPFICQECGRMFACRETLVEHGQYQCYFSPNPHKVAAVVAQRESMPEGMAALCERTCGGIERFVCELCGKVLFRRGPLRDHLRCRAGERPFECDRCVRQFLLECSLKRHEKTHACQR